MTKLVICIPVGLKQREVTCRFIGPIAVTYTLIFMALFIFESQLFIRSFNTAHRVHSKGLT
jgi:hypothetical protein